MKRFWRTATAVLLAAAMLFSLPVSAAPATVSIAVEGTIQYDMAYEVLNLVNAERTARGLKPLVMNTYLLDAATQRAGEIALSFSHTRPDGTQWYTAHNGRFHSSGENIAAGHTSATEVVAAWMNSPGHRANILDADYVALGVGAFKIDGRMHWAQMFATDGSRDTVQKSGVQNAVIAMQVAKDKLTVRSLFGTYSTCHCHRFKPILTANDLPLAASCFTITVANPAVATVQDGYILPKKNGSTTMALTTKDGGYSFVVPLTVTQGTCGDVDMNGKVDSTDARLALQYAVGKINYIPSSINASVDDHWSVDSTDARLILQYAIGKIPAFTRDMTTLL